MLLKKLGSFSLPILICTFLIVGPACQSSPSPAEESSPPVVQESKPVQDEPEVEEDVEEDVEEEDAPVDEETREQAERITDQDLEVFAAGVRAVAEREAQLKADGRDYETRRESASSPGDVVQIEQEILAEMEEALGEVGLEFNGFMMMGQFVRQNDILMERLGEFLDEEEIADFYGIE